MLATQLGAEFASHGAQICMVPVQDVLCGLSLDPTTSSPSAYYVNVFVLPLYAPTMVLTLNAGWRLGGGSRTWAFDDESKFYQLLSAINVEAVPFLRRFSTPSAVIDLPTYLKKERDPIVMEMRFLSQLWLGEFAAARQMAETLRLMLTAAVTWQRRMADRVALLTNTAEREPENVRPILEAWKRDTRQALRLSRFVERQLPGPVH